LAIEAPTPFPFSFVLVGAGRVGTAVSRLLIDAGHSIAGIASRSASSAEHAAHFLDAPVFSLDVALPEADVILLGLPDAAIEPVAKEVARHDVAGRVVWHFSGSLGLGPLEPALDGAALGCALHPVQACPDVATAITRLPGSAWGVTTSPEASGWAARVVTENLSGTPVTVADENRPVWHSAAVIVSNGVAALMAAGESVLASISVDAPETVLGPLAAGTIANAVDGGGGGATLTGPVVRGEAQAIRRHLDALRVTDDDLARSYGLVTAVVIEQAVRTGRLDEGVAAEMRGLLKEEG
jgi:predicted short-subunit dehydrogenase-like oxidoreductase (DUF2520 family)